MKTFKDILLENIPIIKGVQNATIANIPITKEVENIVKRIIKKLKKYDNKKFIDEINKEINNLQNIDGKYYKELSSRKKDQMWDGIISYAIKSKFIDKKLHLMIFHL